MQKNHNDLLNVIRSALIGDVEIDANDIDFDSLFDLSKKHQIIPLVFQGLHKTVGKFDGEEKYHQAVFKLMMRDQNQLYWTSKIVDTFKNNNIDHMLLKGSSVKKLYPATEMRIMGDVDILIREEQYPLIRELLSGLGLSEGKETDHELMWKASNDVLIELHKKLIPSYNDDYYSYYCDAWNKAVLVSDNCYSMSAEDEYIYLFTHLTKHYRDGGIGLRHIIDIWLFNVTHPEMDKDYIRAELGKLELDKFHKNILDTIDVWFDGALETELTSHVTERIIESGSYGIKEWTDVAAATRLSEGASSVSSAKRKKILSLIFMPYSSMKRRYPILERLPFLLPIMWVVRWFDAIFNRKKNVSRHIEKLNQIDEEKVDGYNKELEMVGLKFQFEKK